MNSFTVYLVMQADQIRLGLILVTIFIGCWRLLFFGLCVILQIAIQGEIDKLKVSRAPDAHAMAAKEEKQKEAATKGKRYLRKSFAWFAISISCMSFAPGTKTLAVAYVVPSIAESPAIQQDFPELYRLAVDKLKSQLQESKQ